MKRWKNEKMQVVCVSINAIFVWGRVV